jgi:hypothetical protein
MKIHTVTLDDIVYPLGYKVVTAEMKSLGLRRNPNILTYPLDEWYILPPDQIEEGKGDWGGIWVVRQLGKARQLQFYMANKHDVDTRMFRAALRDVLYCNSYRIKTSGIYLIEEII